MYWPAPLSAGEPIPTSIFVHDYLTIGGETIAKSTGNIIDPTDLVDAYGADPPRWWFAIDVPRLGDADFTEDRFIERATEDLANGYGNLVNRITTLIQRHRPDEPPAPPEQDTLLEPAIRTRLDVYQALDRFDIRQAALAIEALIRAANTYIQKTPSLGTSATPRRHRLRPHHRKSPSTAVQVGKLLQIFTPDLAARALERLEHGTGGVVHRASKQEAVDPNSQIIEYARHPIRNI